MVCYLRKADMNDCNLLFEWANLPSVRQNSFSAGKISYDEYMKWFYSVLKRNNCMQYIFMENDIPIGQARIEINDNVAEISYSIAPERCSQGYDKRLLESLCDEAYKEFPNIKKINW